MLFFFATMVVAKQARDPLAIMHRVYNKEKHREEMWCIFFFAQKWKKRRCLDTKFSSRRERTFLFTSALIFCTHTDK